MNKWIAEFELEDGDIMPEHMNLNYKGAKIDFHCKPLEKEPNTKNDLGVDCIKKSDAIYIIQDMHGLARADILSDAVNKIIDMPSVTPQEPIAIVKIKYDEDKLKELVDKAVLTVIPQEPFINKPCISSGVCEHDRNEVIDKIRDEINKIYEREGNSFDCLNALDELKKFINKYEIRRK